MLAAAFGLSTGAIIGYFFADDKAGDKAGDKNLVRIAGKATTHYAIEARPQILLPEPVPVVEAPPETALRIIKVSPVVPAPVPAPVVPNIVPPPVAALEHQEEPEPELVERPEETIVAAIDADDDVEDFALATEDDALAWERNAVTVPDPAGRPMIAVVIDDLGLNRRNTVRTIRLPGPLTLAFMTYAEQLERQTSQAHAAGHELMVHFPMEPQDAGFDTGPMALTRDLSDDEIRKRLRWGLKRFSGYVGINNHMGSAFTGSERGMKIVLQEMQKRGLLFLDSVTTQNPVARKIASLNGVPFAARDVFLDNVLETTHVEARLREVERIARSQGYAIAIGHPHKATIDALNAWLPKLEEMGFALVPVSLIVKHRQGS